MATPDGGTPIESGLIARLASGIKTGVKFALSGQSAQQFFGPGQPMAPAAQDDTHGRAFDYPVNFNITTRPRGDERIDFPTLRLLADSYDLLRLAIETRKDQMGKLRWTVQRKDTGKQDTTAKAIEAFLQEPDGEHDFIDWSRMLLEDLLVIDAPAVYIQPTRGGKAPAALEVIDGATLKRVIDGRGRTPQPPEPAYQQIIKGLPATDYHADELIYKPRNPRIHKIYGYSPVEQIIVIVNIALRRESHQLAFYTSGNIPDMLMGVPETWNPEQIQKFQKLWDQLLVGDLAARRQLRFVPGGMTPTPLRPESSLFDQFDEWLARVVCYCFSLPPTAFIKQQNRATAESAQDAAIEEGLSPLMEWKVSLMNRLIRKAWNTTDYEFSWLDEQATDPLEQAQIDQIYVQTGIRLPNEVRDDHDWEELPELDEKKMAPPPAPIVAAPAPRAPGEPKPGEPGATTEKPPSPKPPVADATSENSENSEKLAKLLEAVAELRTLFAALAKAEDRPPTVDQCADALAKMVDSGMPLNDALKAAGFNVTVEGGDVAMVAASRIPLALAADPRGFEPPPSAELLERLAKRAEPAPPAPAPIIVSPVVTPAPAVEFHPTINVTLPEPKAPGTKRITHTRNAAGEMVASEITDVPAATAGSSSAES